MKYWVFQNNQVIGPFDRESMGQVAGFSSETLVCPEGRKGTQMGDWQRAGVVPEMAEALLAATRMPALARAGVERGAGSMLPPEPTLRDLAVLGSLQERVSSLEGATQKLQDELRSRDTEIARLKAELDQKARSAAEMQTKVADLEVKAYGLSGVKDELQKAREEARVAGVKLDEHQRALEELRERVGQGLRGAPAPEPSAIPDMSQPPFPAYPLDSSPSPAPLASLGGVPAMDSLGAPAAPEAAGPMGGMGGPNLGGMGRLGELEPAASPFAAAAPSVPDSKPAEAVGPDPFAVPSALGGSGSEALVSLGGASSLAAPAGPPLVPVGDLAEAPKGARDKRVYVVMGAMVVVVAVLVGVFGASRKKKKKAASSVPALTTPSPAPTPLPGAGGEPALDLTQAAVEFVKSYQIPGRQETVAQLLESRYPTTGRLSPWMVEKLENDKYQVNFYASQSESAPGPKPVFQFHVRVRSKLLQGMNPPAMGLLNDGTLPAAEAPKARRGRRAAASLAVPTAQVPVPPAPRRGRKGLDAAAAVLEGLKAGQKAGEPPKARGKPKGKPAADAEGTQLPPEEPGADAGKGGDVHVGANKGEEDEMLDQLLLPGMDKKVKK